MTDFPPAFSTSPMRRRVSRTTCVFKEPQSPRSEVIGTKRVVVPERFSTSGNVLSALKKKKKGKV